MLCVALMFMLTWTYAAATVVCQIVLGAYIYYRWYYKINGRPVSYEHALKLCDLTSLAERRENLTTMFALDMYKNPMHKDFFKSLPDSRPNTRTKQKIYDPSGSTERYNKSAIPTFTRMINSKYS